jgi:hypothetical protein
MLSGETAVSKNTDEPGVYKNPDNERRDEAGLQDSDGSLGIKKLF